MEAKTHLRASERLLGTPLEIEEGKRAVVELKASKEMTVDERGLVHGGFTFGLADYATMLAVNHPHVVLGGSENRFKAPVKLGDLMRAEAVVTSREGRRRVVDVNVSVEGSVVFTGTMTCFILDKHVLG